MNNGNAIKPMGDRKADGYVQLSFTLPVPVQQATEAAQLFCATFNLHSAEIVHLQPLSDNTTYIQAFAKAVQGIAFVGNVADAASYSRDELLQLTEKWTKPLRIIGACTGTDAHTVGLDAILNKKGFKGDKGLESYPCFEVINLGSQVTNGKLIEQIKQHKADVLLVSQIITHQNVHLHNLTELTDMLEATGLRKDLLCLIGGPRITHQLALELGFDGGFGIGTTPVDVANFIIAQIRRL
jgi:beta-lysine 5,6-aminomutase beta subunit